MQDFTNTLIVGISSRTLFDLEKEDNLFKEKGISEYRKVQREKEDEELKPGTGYHLVQALLKLNKDEDPEGCQSKPFTPSVINGFEPLAPIPVI